MEQPKESLAFWQVEIRTLTGMPAMFRTPEHDARLAEARRQVELHQAVAKEAGEPPALTGEVE